MRPAPHLASVPQSSAPSAPPQPPPAPAERYCKPKEVAKDWGVSDGFVYGLIKRGELRAIYFGRLPRIPESALDEYLEKAGQRGGR